MATANIPTKKFNSLTAIFGYDPKLNAKIYEFQKEIQYKCVSVLQSTQMYTMLYIIHLNNPKFKS